MTKRLLLSALILLSLAAAALAAENWAADKVKDALIGKTKIEVKEMFGAPTVVQQFEGDDTGQWIYGYNQNFGGNRNAVILKGRIIYDDVIDKAASGVEIQFKNGGVVRVRLTF